MLLMLGGGFLWTKTRDGSAGAATGKAADQKPADDEAAGPTIEHDANGNVVIRMSDEMQGDIGLKVASPSATQMNPERKGYGRVLDPSPLAALLTELASAQAAYAASSNELVRLKTLAEQGNASTRALQAGEVAAVRDQLALQSARDRLALAWGNAVANQPDLPAFIQSLATLATALVRIDLPAGEAAPGSPSGARITTLSGRMVEADFLTMAASVEPQLQGRGIIFLVRSNAALLLPNEAVTGYVGVPGEPVSGVTIPRDAVVRTEGHSWVYIMTSQADGEIFTRTQIPLDHATETGWFVTNRVTATNYVVITGAQTLLSQELKASLKPD